MQKVARFHKVSYERFLYDWMDSFGDSKETIKEIYDNIKLPKRATKGSAGYDFFAPVQIELKPNETIKIPTGIRVEILEDWVLKLYPRSGLGFKYRLQLNNTVGIIDSDYYYSDNEGHIFAKITNDSNENRTVNINAGEGFMQGIFIQYGITLDDDGNLVVRAKVNYKYSVEYTPYGGEVTTKNNSSYSYITFVYQMVGKDYSLIDAKNLTTYFSKY